ncbi:unnamed protein product [Thlaspi arvense]|uniref:Agenet domain-containing protein n=1 Tax=Thlaspi arvense TaxID=13288 RepID=A0AAU9SHQ3_THLAR|nr:unnamed protein product [Thlaspi arvense]
MERRDGCADLAVVGRMKSSKCMSFRYALKKNRSVLKKLESIEDVADWLNSIVSGVTPHVAQVPATNMTEQSAGGLNIGTYMNGKFKKPRTDPGLEDSLVGCGGGIRSRKRRRSADDGKGDCKANPADASMCKSAKDGSSHHIKKGSLVEVLSQDSGLRGCWFRALIIKKHKDKVKVQYQDIKDADDESKKLEEWILASQVAASDHLGLRNPGRKIVRPNPKPSKENDVWAVGVGVPVDVWWCDGWWEGIVAQQVSEEKFEVYLPGEKKMSVFHRSDLRQSLEWSADEWVHMKPRSDLVSSVLSLKEKKKEVEMKHDEKLSEVCVGDGVMSTKGEAKHTISLPVATSNKSSTKPPVVPDLLKDVLVSELKWNASKKRTARCCPRLTDGFSGERSPDCEKCSSMGDSLFSASVSVRRKRNRIVSRCPHKPSLTDGFSSERSLDCENGGKFMGDSVFGSSVGQHLSGLLMSR